MRVTVGAGLAAAAVMALVFPTPLAMAGPAAAAGFGGPGGAVAHAEPAAHVQQTEPEGVDTTDPEASDEDGSGAPSWLTWVIIGVFTSAFLYWYLRRLQRQDSAPSD